MGVNYAGNAEVRGHSRSGRRTGAIDPKQTKNGGLDAASLELLQDVVERKRLGFSAK